MSHHHSPRVLAVGAGALLAVAGIVSAPAVAHPAAHSGMHGYRQIDLVSDIPGAARITDPNLVNAWGLASSPSSPLWVSDNGKDVTTLYSGAVAPSTSANIVPLVVSIPGGGAPTGQVFNGTSAFALTTGGPALFLFAGEGGDISAWNQAQGTSAKLVVPSTGGVYKGIALVTTRSGSRLLAADFHNNRIDEFNSSFQPVSSRHAFRSVGIPHGYAPFNVAVLGHRVFVSYAKQDAQRHDDVAGAGHGFVNVFTMHGRFVDQFARRGVLDSPWGMTIAPEHFGRFSGDVLIGNFGDGRIHAFTMSGHPLGALRGRDGHPISIDGLWGLRPGNGTAGATSDLWFSAGPDGESHGLLGILRAAHSY